MAKLGTLTLTGASGTKYEFTVYSSDTDFRSGVACVYYISHRDNSAKHTNIYVGQTEDVSDRHEDHHKQDCFEKHGYNAISLHLEESERTRLRIEKDLIASLDPPCNG